MIGNPMVVKQGGGQVYTITDNSRAGFPASAKAGEIVSSRSGEVAMGSPILTDSEGNTIPYSRHSSPVYYYFVMPASDVVISTDLPVIS